MFCFKVFNPCSRDGAQKIGGNLFERFYYERTIHIVGVRNGEAVFADDLTAVEDDIYIQRSVVPAQGADALARRLYAVNFVQERAGRKIGFYLCAGIQKRVVRNAAVGGAL